MVSVKLPSDLDQIGDLASTLDALVGLRSGKPTEQKPLCKKVMSLPSSSTAPLAIIASLERSGFILT